MNATEIKDALRNFTGTEGYLRHNPFGGKGLVVTDGVRFVAEKAGAFWLLDAILSHQRAALKDEMLRDFQFWRLKVNADKSALLTCERDTDDVVISQHIEYTDFPLDEVRLYLALGSVDGENPEYVLMLPSER